MNTTVIIPNFNGKKYLQDCLSSLMECRPQDFSIIVVDNGSNDGSVEFLKDTFKDITLIALPKNTGFSNAVNVGIEHANTEFVILLNNDTRVDKNFVKNLEKSIIYKERLFSVSAKMLSMQSPDKIDGTGDLYCALGWAFALGKGENASTSYTKETSIFSSCAGAAIYRTKLLREIGLFDENHFAYLEDVDIGYRARINGYENRFEPGAICFHAGSAASGSRYNKFKIALSSKNSIYLIYKNMPIIQIILNFPFLIVGFMIKIMFFMMKGYGYTYCKGVANGIAYCFTKEARLKKVHFKKRNIKNYIMIQLQLWINIVRRIIG